MVFDGCSLLTNVSIPNSVVSLGDYAFAACINLASLVIPGSVTNIGNAVFAACTSLTGVYFKGNAPTIGWFVFDNDNLTVYYAPGTTGWGTTFSGRPTKQWYPPPPQISMVNVGVQMSQFGFLITGTSNLVVVVDACTNFAQHGWQPVQTNTLGDGLAYFSDPQWAKYPARCYRLRSP
jgi:hypothetical protein